MLIKKYYEIENKFTAYMATFFFLRGFSALFWILSSEWVFDVFEKIQYLIMISIFIPRLVLLFFILTFYKIALRIRIAVMIILGGFLIISFIISVLLFNIPPYPLLIIISLLIVGSNVILFILNWRRNEDIKSLFFSIGLICILIGMLMLLYSPLIQGILLIATSIIWTITYSGLLDYFVEYNKK
jgi:hypothetical protein